MKKDKFVLGCSLFSCAALFAQERQVSPNIIYILMDDLDYGDL